MWNYFCHDERILVVAATLAQGQEKAVVVEPVLALGLVGRLF